MEVVEHAEISEADRASFSPDMLTPEELLNCVPTAAELQEDWRTVAETMQAWSQVRPQVLATFMALEAIIHTLPTPLGNLVALTSSMLVRTGNFLHAGGEAIFKDPPERSAETSNAEP